MPISLFVTCLTDLFYPEVAECVVRVLRRLGHRVDFPAAQTCCGQPALNSGFLDEARSVAASTSACTCWLVRSSSCRARSASLRTRSVSLSVR